MERLLHKSGGARALACLGGLLLCLFLCAAPAGADPIRGSINMTCLTGLDVTPKNLFNDDLSKLPDEAVPAWLARYLFGTVEEHLYEMMAEESWGAWDLFQAVPGRTVPVAEAGRILEYAHEGYLPKRPTPYYTDQAAKKPKVQKGSPPLAEGSPGQALLTLFRQPPNYYRGGLFKPARDTVERGPFNPFRWLTRVGDQWSTAEWDTVDFLAKVGRMGIIVFLVLGLIEVLHLLVNMGRKRQQPPETQE